MISYSLCSLLMFIVFVKILVYSWIDFQLENLTKHHIFVSTQIIIYDSFIFYTIPPFSINLKS